MWRVYLTRLVTVQNKCELLADLNQCILSMCDIQIMTGFALLSCGFTLAFSASEPLASYHWFLIVCLAWFSAITHLAGLSILRTYLDCRPRVKATRIVLMFLLLVCLIIALIPTGFFNWHQMKSVAAPQSPAICFFDISAAMKLWNRDWYGSEVMETSAMQQMVLAVILLVLGFTSRCIKLFQPLSRMLRRAVRTPAHDYFTLMFNRLAILLLRRPQINASLDMTVKHGSFRNQFWTFAVFIPLVGLFLTGRFFGDLISSMLAEVRASLNLYLRTYLLLTNLPSSDRLGYHSDHVGNDKIRHSQV